MADQLQAQPSSDLKDLLAPEQGGHIAEIYCLENVRHGILVSKPPDLHAIGGADSHFSPFVLPFRLAAKPSMGAGLRACHKDTVNKGITKWFEGL